MSYRPSSLQSETEDLSEDADDIIMALDRKGPKIGCAYYTFATETLSLMEDLLFPSPDCTAALKFQIKPTTLLIPSRLDEIEQDPEDTECYRTQVRPAADFSYDNARSKLIALRIGDDDGPDVVVPADLGGECTSRGNLLRLAAWVDLESKITVGCAGAVLAFLQRRKAVEARMDQGDGMQIGCIEMFSLKNVMFVNADTICSLQIFEDESHPNFHMQGQGGRGKEGLSLFGILNMTRSPLGHRMLKQWFLRPSLSIEIINERQESISVLLRADNDHVLKTLGRSLKKVKNIPKIIGQLKRGQGGGKRGGEWDALVGFVLHALKIRNDIQELSEGARIPIFQKIMNSFDTMSLQNVGQVITDTIDFETSANINRVVVKDGVDTRLDEMRHLYAGMDSMLGEVARQISATAFLPDGTPAPLNVVYFPQIGYLISVPSVSRNMAGTGSSNSVDAGPDFVGEDWEFQFCTATMWYYKNPQMREMDEYFGDTYGMIGEREIEIIHELQVRVLEYEKTLTECIRVSAELDCLMALAEAASKYKYTRPTMTTQNILEIEKGRHPLQELCVPSYVENPTFLVGGAGDPPFSNSPTPTPTPEGPSTLLLTGPNYSGKSVYLKQVALIVYMAHIGSFVPASNATIGITDAILTRIQTRESVSKVQSAFMIDLQQISLMLRVCTARSLLIIDEFGKGTSSSDGAGLACAVFEHLLSLAENNPKVLGATHYHEIFEHGFLLDYPALSLGHMRVLLDDAAQLPEGQITYLYKLEPGRKGSSFGTMCAVLNGIEESVVARADDLILLMARGEDLVAACARLTDEERGELEIAEISVRRFLQEFGDDEEEEEEEEDGEGAETTRARLERALRS